VKPSVPPTTRINPKTGRAWTLADPEIKTQLRQESKAMSPAKAREFLEDVGVITATGKIARRYGG